MTTILILIGFFICYALIVTDKFPRASVTMAAGGLFMLCGAVSMEKAWAEYIDFRTLALLIGMMIVITILRRTGLFQYIALKMAKLAQGEPRRLFLYFCVITAVLSAFLDNVTTVMIMAPITLLVCETLQKDPFPFLFMEIVSSNIGGTATLIGDPPNILIGSAARFSFNDFIWHLTPIAVIAFIIIWMISRILFRGSLKVSEEAKRRLFSFDERKALRNPKFLRRSLGVLTLILFGFFTHDTFHIEPAVVAFAGGGLLLFATKLNPEEVFKELEWDTIFFFIGLFIVIGAIEEAGLIEMLAQFLATHHAGPGAMILIMLWISAIFSCIVGSVPTTIAFIPLIKELSELMAFSGAQLSGLWWALALGACFGGNGTIVASAANVVVAGIAEKSNHTITFKKYVSYGVPFTFITILISSVYIWIRYVM